MRRRLPIPLVLLVLALGLVLDLQDGRADDVAAAAPPAVAAASEGHGSADPLEPFNRAMFTFNDGFDTYVLRPVATGWDFVMPRPVENAFSRFFENLRFPIRFANTLLQGRIDPAAITLCRFLVNSSFGLVGFFDVATDMGLPRQYGDFGQTLGIWGFPGGPYIVWPIFGPSNPRDTVGLVADSYLAVGGFFIDWYYLAAARAVDTVNSRALALEEIDRAREASFDFYTAVRAAYLERRRSLIEGAKPASQGEELDLYFPDYSDQSVVP